MSALPTSGIYPAEPADQPSAATAVGDSFKMASKRPGKNAGEMSSKTELLRGPLPLTKDQRAMARFLRFEVGKDWPDVASAVGRTIEEVRHALANARTAHNQRKRVTLNVSPALGELVESYQLPGEAMWQTMNRLFGVI
jgi:hypothetical protein